MSLNPRQTGFISEYLVDRNATQAAIRAGYSKRSARQIATRMLSNDVIKAQIQVQCQEAEKRLEISRDDILRGFLSAYKHAEEQGQPMGMVAALREVGKLLGYYDARHCQEPLPGGDVDRFRRELQTLPEKELLRLARGSGEGGA